MANFLIRWKPYSSSKSYSNVLSARQIREWAHAYAINKEVFLKTGANVRECIKFLDSHYVYLIATPHRGALRSRNLDQQNLFEHEQIRLGKPISPWGK